MDLEEIWYDDEHGIQLVKDRVQWQALVNMVVNL
jgi:hypothetical protein